jgi:hypothetical protein
MPDAAQELRDIPLNTVPYISAVDLIIFKIHSCGLRAQPAKKRTDAFDAEALLRQLGVTAQSPLSLTTDQQGIVEPCITDVVANGTKDETWWKQRLGLPIPQANADDYWTWNEQRQGHYHDNGDGTCHWMINGQFSTTQL